MPISQKTIFLILLHLFLLNVLFTYRYPPSEAYSKMKLWDKGMFEGKVKDYVRLYFSDPSDEAYYYEWSTLVLGKKFEETYPLEKRTGSRVKDLFYQNPQLRLPYRDIEFEYPPTLILPLLSARFLSADYMSFTRVLAGLLSAAYLLCLYCIWKIWNQIPGEKKIEWNKLLGLSAIFILCLGQLYVTRLDVLATLMTLLSLLSFIQNKYKACSLWTALAALTKGFPVLLAPLYALTLIKEKKWKALGVSTFLLLFVLIFINIGMAQMTQGAYWDSFKYHADRGIQIESLWALIPFWKNLILHTPILIYNSHTCSNITMQKGEILLNLSKYTGPLLFLLIYFLYGRNLFKNQSNSLYSLIAASLALIFAFMLSFKALSPQFLIWLSPLLFLYPTSHKKIFFGLWLLAAIITQLIFPNFYELVYQAQWQGIFLLTARNGILIVLLIWILKFTHNPSSQQSPPKKQSSNPDALQ